MFSPQPYAPAGRPNPFANAYRQVGDETAIASADPHHLVTMLFDGYLDAIAQAKGAMRGRQIEAKARAIGRAVRIVEEGLRACLDMTAGGKLALDLNDLYGYLARRLTLANLRNDETMLDECQRLITPVREAWLQISPDAARVQGQ